MVLFTDIEWCDVLITSEERKRNEQKMEIFKANIINKAANQQFKERDGKLALHQSLIGGVSE